MHPKRVFQRPAIHSPLTGHPLAFWDTNTVRRPERELMVRVTIERHIRASDHELLTLRRGTRPNQAVRHRDLFRRQRIAARITATTTKNNHISQPIFRERLHNATAVTPRRSARQ